MSDVQRKVRDIGAFIARTIYPVPRKIPLPLPVLVVKIYYVCQSVCEI